MKEDGCALQYIKEQTPELCLVAVKETGIALLWVKEQTSELCWEAVQQNNGRFLQYVKDQTPELCWEAVKQNERVLKYVRDPILREQIKIHFNL